MDKKTHSIHLCRAFSPDGCKFSVNPDPELPAMLEKVFENPVWTDFVAKHLKGGDFHNQFKVRISGCVNGCSMPQIADVGIMAAMKPGVDSEKCTSCGSCVMACPEMAISMPCGKPSIDLDLCLDCGRCALACPEKAMKAGVHGYKVLVGGRLGRHPKLGRDLGHIFTSAQVAKIVENCLVLYSRKYRPGLRFGPIADKADTRNILWGVDV